LALRLIDVHPMPVHLGAGILDLCEEGQVLRLALRVARTL
jgi:hypothetical protein